MEKEKLVDIGFSDNEARVYINLLENENMIVSEISKKTKINRSLLYTVLEGLADKGIASYILKNNVRHYRAAEPEKILAMMREKEKMFEEILPQLISLNKPKSKRPIIEILEGKEGIKTILNDLLRIKKEWFAYNIPGKGPEIMGPGVHLFEKERQKMKIRLNVIVTKTESGTRRGEEFSDMKFTKVKVMPKKYQSPASNWIYGDRLVIIFWYREFPFAIRIIDKNLAESYKNHFKVLWKEAKELR